MTRPPVGARAVAAVTGSLFALSFPATFALSTAHAGTGDRDGDGIPNRWERTHGMNPRKAADAQADFDRDRLVNLAEYRSGSRLRDEDTDNDGHDDGDEVKDGFRATHVLDADTDHDGTPDGDEDADRDGTPNEDEDDAREGCARDDDDRDGDHVDDEDEDELGTLVRSADSDGDGVTDGDEDDDEDGEANEDEDDDALDRCDGDLDGDGEADEDDEDLFGSVVSFDDATSTLTLESISGHVLTLEVTEDTEIEIEGEPAPTAQSAAEEDSEGDGESEDEGSDEDESDEEDREGSTADLVPGAQVAEIEVDDDTGTLEEITLYA